MEQQSRLVHSFVLAIAGTTGLTLAFVPTAGTFSRTGQSIEVPIRRLAAQTQSKVTIEGFQFKPASLTVKVGSSVVFTNKDSAPHTVTPAKGATFTGTGRINSNESKTVVFNQVGSQPYFCELHPSMKGTINVVK